MKKSILLVLLITILTFISSTSIPKIGKTTQSTRSFSCYACPQISFQDFAVLAASTITNTGSSSITGSAGLYPGTSITGFPPGSVSNSTRVDSVAQLAIHRANRLFTKFNDCDCDQDLTGKDLGNLILTPKTYSFSSSAQLTGTLTLDAQGDSFKIFVFQIGTTLTTASYSKITFINEAQPCNVFWIVGSSATFGTYSELSGVFIAQSSITATTGTSVNGRLFALDAAVTLNTNNIQVCYCQSSSQLPSASNLLTTNAYYGCPAMNAIDFAVLAASTITNTGSSSITGSTGLFPGTSITGFPPGSVSGSTHIDSVAQSAQQNINNLFSQLRSGSCDQDLTGRDLGNLVLTPKTYCFSSSVGLTGTLTLDAQGDSSKIFVFQIGSTITTASYSRITLINGAQPCNIFWLVGSSATFGEYSRLSGVFIAQASITATTYASINGRLFALNGAITLNINNIQVCYCQSYIQSLNQLPTSTSTTTSQLPRKAHLTTTQSFVIIAQVPTTVQFTTTQSLEIDQLTTEE